jgi:hypothetical protein
MGLAVHIQSENPRMQSAAILFPARGVSKGRYQCTVHISSARFGETGLSAALPLRWAFAASLGLHLLVFWPAPGLPPRPVQVSGPIKAELRPSLQGVPSPAGGPLPAPGGVVKEKSPEIFDRPVRTKVPAPSSRARQEGKPSRLTRPLPGPPSGADPVPASRQEGLAALQAVPVSGDALTRFRLGLAWHLGRLGAVPGGLPEATTVELSIHLSEGRVMGVEVTHDGGRPAVAAWAAEQTRLAAADMALPDDLGAATLRVDLALRFEP